MNNIKVAKIVIDRKACIGAATCVILAPEAFELDEEGVAKIKETSGSVNMSKLMEAALSCPTQAISFLDEGGNKIELK